MLAATIARRGFPILPSLLATASSVVAMSTPVHHTTTDCDGEHQQYTAVSKAKSSNIRTRMTTIGRFSIDSETSANPSIPTFFLSLAGPRPFTKDEFCDLWKQKGMEQRHVRFHQVVDAPHNKHFYPSNTTVEDHVKEVVFPMVPRLELAHRIANYLTTPMDLSTSLWHLDIMSGPLGRSGAISQRRQEQIEKSIKNGNRAVETLLLFRSHHAMADGVSLVTAITELCDEWEELQAQLRKELLRRKGSAKTLLQKFLKWIQKMLWLSIGSIRAWSYHLKLVWSTSTHPFAIVKALSDVVAGGRSVSWCEVTSVAEVKSVAAAFGSKVTINDVWVSCVSYAVARQLYEHQQRFGLEDQHCAPTINVVIPVHLQGGILLPGQSLGNRIGAFAARVPGQQKSTTAGERLLKTHESLYMIKQTPAALMAYLTTQIFGRLPGMPWIFQRANANASVAVTNVQSAPYKLHIKGIPVEGVGGFLPLPPGIPIGVAVQSYAGTMQLSVTAEVYAVPDPDKFLGWMVEEYQRLLDQAEKIRRNK